MIQLKYRFKNDLEEHFLEVENARMKCPICQTWVKNVHLHLNRKPNCKKLIDMEHFDPIYKDYQKEIFDKKHREAAEKWRKKQKLEDPVGYNQKAKDANQKARDALRRST